MKKTRRFFLALLPMAVALIFASCGSSDEVAEPTPADGGTKTIPVKITVGMDDATRATVGSDNSTLYFHTADKLAVLSGGSCIALLENTTIAEGSSSATFQGNMTVPSDVSSYGEVTVVLIGNENIGVQTTTNYSWANNGPAICVGNGSSSALNEAVKKYSYLTGTGAFDPNGQNSFTLTQHTAFLNIAVTFKDETVANTNLSVTVTNNSSTIGTGTVTTETDATSNDVVAKFVVPVAAGTTMNGTSITFTGKDPITLSSTATLEGKSYKIEKWIATPPAGVQAVDLGLPSGTKWANMNVGAESEEDFGLYFMWGDVTGYDKNSNLECSWATYIHSKCAEVGGINLTKYVTENNAYLGYNNYYDNLTELLPEDDAASWHWGCSWRTPSLLEVMELLNNTNKSEVRVNGVLGVRFTSKVEGYTDKSIFIPENGCFQETTNYANMTDGGGFGYCWTSTLDHSDNTASYEFYIDSGSSIGRNHRGKYACSVRPVHD